MEINEKLELNKKIRSYDGNNTFILSLKSQLKSNKYLERVDIGKRKIKILSDNQYEISKTILI